jgi:hypothetical protein
VRTGFIFTGLSLFSLFANAQYCPLGSGAIETIDKSSTRDFHSDLFEFMRNSAFNVRNVFAQCPLLQKERFQIHRES